MPDSRMLGYLSDYMQEFREIRAIMDSLQAEVDELEEKTQGILEDTYIDTASLAAIEHYERMLGIKASPGASVEDRRRAVKAILYDTGGYTLKSVLRYLDSILGAGAYTVAVSGYVFQIGLSLSVKSRYADVENYLRRTIPANMAISVDYIYNTHAVVHAYTHGALHNRTHREIREEELT